MSETSLIAQLEYELKQARATLAAVCQGAQIRAIEDVLQCYQRLHMELLVSGGDGADRHAVLVARELARLMLPK